MVAPFATDGSGHQAFLQMMAVERLITIEGGPGQDLLRAYRLVREVAEGLRGAREVACSWRLSLGRAQGRSVRRRPCVPRSQRRGPLVVPKASPSPCVLRTRRPIPAPRPPSQGFRCVRGSRGVFSPNIPKRFSPPNDMAVLRGFLCRGKSDWYGQVDATSYKGARREVPWAPKRME